MQPEQSLFRKNIDHHGKDGSGEWAITPTASNWVYDTSFSLPAGVNNKVGHRESKETNETYVLVHNSNLNHVLYRIRGGKCENVFIGPELELINDPEFYVGLGSFEVKRVCIGVSEKTFCVWTNGKGNQKHLCVEDSIATGYFNPSKFSYFAGSHYSRTTLVNLGVPSPTDCIAISEIASPPDTINRLKKHVWRFRIKTVDVYGRPSEHGVISDPYYQSDCHSENISCLDLTFDAGGPLVDKIQVEYNNTGTTEWSIHKTLSKYKKCDREWWLRDINTKDFSFNPTTNKITFRFCPGGECIPVPDVESQRVENPLPLSSRSLFSVAGGIGLANNQYGYGAFACELLDKVKFKVEPNTDPDPVTVTRNITIYVPIFNAYEGYWEGVWKKDNMTVFGGVGIRDGQIGSAASIVGGVLAGPVGAILGAAIGGTVLEVQGEVGTDFGQRFPDGQEGFVGYLAGTKYACVSEQYRADIQNNKVVGWVKAGAGSKAADIRNNLYIQKFEFKNVPAGQYVFRIAGHESKISDPNYQRTSTFVAGTCKMDHKVPQPNRITETRELFVDVCNTDYDSLSQPDTLMIWDMTHPENAGALERNSRVVSGYVYEKRDTSGNGNLPIELAGIVVGAAAIARRVYTTDHNGFYFCGARDGNYIIRLTLLHGCKWENLESFRVDLNRGLVKHDFVAQEQWVSYDTDKCNRTIVKGKVIDCATKAGVPNVTVGITRGQFASTNNNGEFELIVHDMNPRRSDKVILLGVGSGCLISNCDGGPCFTAFNYTQSPCSAVGCAERVVTATTFQVKLKGVGKRGLQFGGRYGFAINGSDWMDRKNFAQTKPEWYLDIPTVNELQSFNFPRIKWEIDSSARFPSWVDKLYFRFTPNLAYNDFITWVVDRFELVDNSGLENKITPTQIRVYYDSLNEYNKQYQFSTNSTWQIVDEQDSIQTKDIIQWVANGDGKIFSKVITDTIRFDKDGRYFQIDYNPELADLKEGALFKIMRPGQCKQAEIFFELCKTVAIKNGIPLETSGYLNAYDSYQVTRQIPTPVTTVKKVQKPVAGSSNPVVYETVDQSVTANVVKPYSWLFEHHAPSDHWGAHSANRGRPLVQNPLESVVCKETEIALSGALGVNGLTNYLHYFDDVRKTSYDNNGSGPITAVINRDNRLLVIYRSGWDAIPYDDDSVIVSGGRAIVKSADKQLGKPLQKKGEFGCHPLDKNTIVFAEDKISWLDRNRVAYVFCNFQEAANVSEHRYYDYIRNKVRAVVESNGDRYFHQVYDPKSKQILLTDFNRKNPSYANDADDFDAGRSETVAIDAETGKMRRWCSFTPEGYATLEGDSGEEQLFAFKAGIPYAHHKAGAVSVLNFFGVQCGWALRPVVTVDPLSVKEFISVEFYCKDTIPWVPVVLTESGQSSRIPRNFFQRGERYSVAPLLCDLNTPADPNMPIQTGPNKLFDGDNLRGRWLDMLITSTPDERDKYFELTGIVVNVNGVKTGGEK